MADEEIHPSMCPLKLQEIEHEAVKKHRLRRFSMSRMIHRIAIRTSGGERLAEKEEVFFRAGGSMREERDGMRTRRCGGKPNRGCVSSQHYFFDAAARLDH